MHNSQQHLSEPLDEQLRRAYLHAMGVPVWLSRERLHKESKREVSSGADNVVANANTIKNEIATNELVNTQRVVEDLSATLSVTPNKLSTDAKSSAHQRSSSNTPEKLEPIDCSTMNWATLQSRVSACQACALHTSRNQAVLGSGDQSAKCIIIGDIPTSEDDKKGHPFVGSSGQLLTNMLLAIDLPRNTVYLTNATKCRASNDRMPSHEELAQCSNYLYRQIELIKPEKILILGRTAAQHLLQKKAPLARLRGKIHTLPNTQIPAVVTYHPRNLLKQSKDKRKAWEDLKLFRKIGT
ncbi:MAG: uracil-DNA glycosylase [Thiotrichaceae bacterium]